MTMTKPSKPAIKDLIGMLDQLKARKEERTTLQDSIQVTYSRIKNIDKAIEEMKAKIIPAMEDLGMEATEVAGMTVKMTKTDIPVLEDFGKMFEFAKEYNMPELFHRRINVGAFREQFWDEENKRWGLGPGSKIAGQPMDIPEWASIFTRKDLKVKLKEK